MRSNRIKNGFQNDGSFGRQNQLFSPTSSDINSNEIVQVQQLKPIVAVREQKTQNMLQNMKVKFLLNTLIKKLRYLSPPLVIPQHVHQQWQSTPTSQSTSSTKIIYTKQTLSQQLSHRYQIFRHLNLLQGILIVVFCWIVTVSIVWQVKFGVEIMELTLLVGLLRVGVIAGFGINEKDQGKEPFLLHYFKDLASPALLVLGSGLFIIRYEFDLGIFTYFIQLFGFLTAIVQYRKIQTNFQNIVKWAQQNRMKKQLRIIELFLLIITLAHFFSLIMQLMSHISPNGTNWLKKAKLDDQQWYIQYIYCFYWAITTTVTVGYGDLTPANHYEVLFVTVIQLIGTAVFGYMINVIGITVDQIKKKSQEFDNHQQTIDKLQDHYQLSRQLCHKMKHDIKQKQNQFQNIPLKTSQQKNFLQYIQPTLKQQFVLQTNMRVIKKSIFFLTHFSVNFQNQIALRLIRIIYKPQQQVLTSNEQKQRNLIIINSGQVDIYIEQNHNNMSITKKVREIRPSEDSLVMNVYGYSSMIMNRDIRLKAVAKETAVSYVLRRKDILECIDKSLLDFQSFNEMREKMTNYKMLQEIQAPTLKQHETHFIPNIFLIQKKIKYQNQSRLSYSRLTIRTKLKFITSRNYQNKTLPKIDDDIMQGQNFIIDDQDFNSLKSFGTNKMNENITYFAKDDRFVGKLRMDQYKFFQNFLKSFNLPAVAAAYEKACQKKSYRKRMRTSVIKKNGTFVTHYINKLKKVD